MAEFRTKTDSATWTDDTQSRLWVSETDGIAMLDESESDLAVRLPSGDTVWWFSRPYAARAIDVSAATSGVTVGITGRSSKRTGWLVERSTASTGPWTTLVANLDPTATQHFDNTGTTGATYYYRVTAVRTVDGVTKFSADNPVSSSIVYGSTLMVTSLQARSIPVNSSDREDLRASGGTRPYVWRVSSADESIITATVNIRGGDDRRARVRMTAVSAGSTTVTVTVTDADGASVDTSATIFGIARPTITAPSFTVQASRSRQEDVVYTGASTTNASIELVANPSTPTWIVYNSTSGRVEASPPRDTVTTTTREFEYTLEITDAFNVAVRDTGTITVTPPPVVPTVTVADFSVEINTNAFERVVASGFTGTPTFTLTGSPPSWLTIEDDGEIEVVARPRTANANTRAYSATIRAVSGSQQATDDFIVTVTATQPAIAVTAPSFSIQAGAPSHPAQQATATNAQGTVTYAKVGTTPTWVTVSSSGSVTARPGISVTPGDYAYRIRGTDSRTTSAGTDTADGVITVTDPPAGPTVTAPSFSVTRGDQETRTISFSGTGVTLTLQSGPSWVEQSGSQVTASPTSTTSLGQHNYTIRATDSYGRFVDSLGTITVTETTEPTIIYSVEDLTVQMNDIGRSPINVDPDSVDDLVFTLFGAPSWIAIEDDGDGPEVVARPTVRDGAAINTTYTFEVRGAERNNPGNTVAETVRVRVIPEPFVISVSPSTVQATQCSSGTGTLTARGGSTTGTVTYTAVGTLPRFVSLSGNTITARPNIGDTAGDYNVTVRGTRGTDTDDIAFIVRVLRSFAPEPTITAPSFPVTAGSGGTDRDVTITGGNNLTVTFNDGGNTWITYAPPTTTKRTGTITANPGFSVAAGPYSYSLSVQDECGRLVTANGVVTVREQLTVFVANVTLDPGDVELEDITYSGGLTNTEPTWSLRGESWMTIIPSDRGTLAQVRFAPPVGTTARTYSGTLTGTRGSEVDTHTFTATVRETFTVSVNPSTLVVAQCATGTATISISNPGPGPVVYRLSGAPSWVGNVGPTITARPPSNARTGVHSFTVSASTSTQSASTTMFVTVTSAGTPPYITAPSFSVLEGSSTRERVSFGPSTGTTVAKTAGPSWITYASGVVSANARGVSPGNYSYTLTITDSPCGRSVPSTGTVTVTRRTPPFDAFFSPALIDVEQGGEGESSVSVSGGSSSGLVSYSNASGPSWVSFDSFSGTATARPGSSITPSSYGFTVQATRGTESAVAALTIRVTAPALALSLPTTFFQMDTGDTRTVQASARGGSPPYVWSTIANGAVSSTITQGGLISVTGNRVGSGTVSVTVRDSANDTATSAIAVIVNEAPTTPLSLNAIADQFVEGGGTTQVTATAVGGSPPYRWSLSVFGTHIVTASISTSGVITIFGANTGREGNQARISVTVRDSAGDSAFAGFTVTWTEEE